MFSIRHWTWWNWLLAAILMPLLAGSIGLTIFIGLAVIALMARLLFGPAPPWDPELDAPIIGWVPDDAAPCWNDDNRLVGSMFDETERREL